MNITLEITSSVAERDGGEKKLYEFADVCRRCGFNPAVQLHNTVTGNAVRKIIDCGLEMSAHAPVVGDYSLNLATRENLDIIFGAFDANAAFMRKYNITRSVFHGFSMCDDLIVRMKTLQDYQVALKNSSRDELLMQDSALNIDYTHFDEYEKRRDILTENLTELRRRYPDLLFCIENDMPIYGYSNMRLSQMKKLAHPVCLDTGHLYAASLLLDFDFFDELEYGVENLDVQMVHLHNSFVTADTPKDRITDGHKRLVYASELDWHRAVKIFTAKGINDFVLEIADADTEDVLAFAEAVNS